MCAGEMSVQEVSEEVHEEGGLWESEGWGEPVNEVVGVEEVAVGWRGGGR